MSDTAQSVLQLLLRNSPLAWLAVDGHGRVVDASQAARRLLGKPEGRTMQELFVPRDGVGDWPPTERLVEASTRTKPPRWCRLALSPVGNGAEADCLVQVEDLTALRPLGPARGPGADALAVVAHVAHFGMWHWDLATNAMEWSPELRQLFGVEGNANPPADQFLEFVHPEDRARVAALMAEVRAGAPHEQVEYRIVRRPDGTVRRMRTSGTIVERRAGRPVRMTGVTQDLTDDPGLEELRIRYEALFHGLPVGLYRTAPSGELLDANPGLARLMGRASATELIGQDVRTLFIDPSDRDEWRDIMAHDGSVVGYETCLRAADGSIVWVRDSARTILDAAGNVAYYEGILEDVTPEHEARTALERSEARMRALLEHASEGFSIIDPSGQARFSSTSVRRMLGVPDEEWVDQSVFFRVHPDDRAAAEHAFHSVVSIPNGSAATEVRLRRGDNTYRLYRVVARNLAHDPAIRGIVLNTRDVTDERAAEEAVRAREREVRASQRFLQATLDALPEHVAILDGKGVIRAVNTAWRAFARANGWQEKSVGIGTNYAAVTEAGALAGADRAAAVLEGLREVLRGRREVFYTEYAGHSPTERRWFSVTISSFLLDRQRHAVVAHEDITARHELEEQLRHAQKMDAIGLLAGGIAHDFNNLMTSVLGHAALVAEADNLTAEQRQEIKEIQHSGERAAALTQHLLAFSRKQVLQPRVINLNEVLQGMESMLQRLLGEDVTLVVEVDRGDRCVRADPNQLEQVILNLALNARDAMPGGGSLRLKTADVQVPAGTDGATLRPGSWVSLRVQDTGRGMSAEVVERIFEPFFTTKRSGTGLGLSTVYGIVKQSGGEVEVHTRPGGGTVFEVFLPSVDEAPEPVPVTEREEPPRAAPGGETILVVEDEDAVRDFAEKALRRKGYDVLAANGGAEALRIMAERGAPVALVLTDVVMPEMSGPELVRRLGVEHGGTPVIFTSGYTEDQVVNRGGTATGIHFLPKPFSPADLARKVREVLDGCEPHS